MPARVLCTTFSQDSASFSTSAVSRLSSVIAMAGTKPVFFNFSLWHTTQYWFNCARFSVAAVIAVVAGAVAAADFGLEVEVWDQANGAIARHTNCYESNLHGCAPYRVYQQPCYISPVSGTNIANNYRARMERRRNG